MEPLFHRRLTGVLSIAAIGTLLAAAVGQTQPTTDVVEGEIGAATAAAESQPTTDELEQEPAGELRVWPRDPLVRFEGEAEAVGRVDLWPRLAGSTLTWFAIVVILALTLRLKPLVSEGNLDGLVLAATCLLLALRVDASRLPGWAAGQTAQWWSYLLLSLAAGYWLLRGVLCLFARSVRRIEPTVSGGALAILVVAGLAIGVAHVATDSLSAGSRDGIVGGLHVAETGKLPYGEATAHDSRSPLLYLLHAVAVGVVRPEYVGSERDAGLPMSWQNREQWLGLDWWEEGEFPSARLLNGLLFVVLLLALYVIGHRLHSASIGLTMMAIFCVFPGTVECVSRPEIMLPAGLFAWSMVLALVPGAGGLLATALLVLAGVAWPWAWLGVPVVLGYSFRNGWHGFGSVVGLVGGVASVLAGLTWLTLPSVPRAEAGLYRAGLEPSYVIDRGEDDILRITQRASAGELRRGLLRPFWKFLVTSEELVLDTAVLGPGLSQIYPVDEIDARKLLYRRLEPTEAARAEVAKRYRAAMRGEPTMTRVWAGLRTVLEQTWVPAVARPTPLPGAWAVWSRPVAGGGWWPAARQVVKVLVGILAILAGLVLLRRRSVRPVHLMGGFLVVASATLLAGEAGAVTNLAWLLPAALAVWAGHDEPPEESDTHRQAIKRVAERLKAEPVAPPPRITVED